MNILIWSCYFLFICCIVVLSYAVFWDRGCRNWRWEIGYEGDSFLGFLGIACLFLDLGGGIGSRVLVWWGIDDILLGISRLLIILYVLCWTHWGFFMWRIDSFFETFDIFFGLAPSRLLFFHHSFSPYILSVFICYLLILSNSDNLFILIDAWILT
jgi:hypothetical protein